MIRTAEYNAVTRALRRHVPSALPVAVVAEPIGFALAELLDPCAVHLASDPSYALAESIVDGIEQRHACAQLVIVAGNEWSTRLLSAAGVRPWPQVFEPLRGLGSGERQAFIRRACNAARAGTWVCGIEPWRNR